MSLLYFEKMTKPCQGEWVSPAVWMEMSHPLSSSHTNSPIHPDKVDHLFTFGHVIRQSRVAVIIAYIIRLWPHYELRCELHCGLAVGEL